MSLVQATVRACYRLEQSTAYRRGKTAVYDLLENPRARVRPYFDVGMILLVVLSMLLLLFAVKHDLGVWADAVEHVAVTLFILEYLGRMWLYDDVHRILIQHYERAELLNIRFSLARAMWDVVRRKWEYATTPLAIVDLLAILPSYRPLRILRVFLLFRLFKLFRYARSVNQFVQVLSEKRIELYTLFSLLAFVLLIGASAIYLFEQPEYGGQIHSFLDGVYWALVTLSTVGYGDITPHTTEGRVVTLVLIMFGVGVIAFFTSIIVSAFNARLPEVYDQRVFAEIERRPGHVIICGFGRVGETLAQHLAEDHDHFVIVDPDAGRIARAKRLGFLAVQGAVESIELLKSLGVERGARLVMCLTGDDVVNVYVTLTARQLNPGIEIISRANLEASVSKLKQAGANHTLLPYKVASLIAGEYVGQPVAFEAIQGVVMGRHEIALETVVVQRGSVLEGRKLCELPIRDMRLILFGVITLPDRECPAVRAHFQLRSRRFQFNPGGDFVLQADDVLVMFGHQFSMLHFKEQVEARRL